MKRATAADDKTVDRRSQKVKLSQFANTRSKARLVHQTESTLNEESNVLDNKVKTKTRSALSPKSKNNDVSIPESNVAAAVTVSSESPEMSDPTLIKETSTLDSKIKSKIKTALSSKSKRNDVLIPDNHVLPAVSVSSESSEIAEQILHLEKELCMQLKDLNFGSTVQYVYNPVEYAFDTHAMYVRKYGNNPKKILFLGINPGPWGMSQTGVPFGEIAMTRSWLGISGPVNKPAKEHPERLVTGFECTRSEVSGKRLWSLFKELCGTADNFFANAYVHNYCPLALMNAQAKNITPQELKGNQMEILYSKCNDVLAHIIKLLNVEIIVGIGRFAEAKAKLVVDQYALKPKVFFIFHPSPRAVGNQNWDEKAKKRLEELDLLQYFTKNPTTS